MNTPAKSDDILKKSKLSLSECLVIIANGFIYYQKHNVTNRFIAKNN